MVVILYTLTSTHTRYVFVAVATTVVRRGMEGFPLVVKTPFDAHLTLGERYGRIVRHT